MTEYCTCTHLKRDAVRGACKIVAAMAPDGCGIASECGSGGGGEFTSTSLALTKLMGSDKGQWLACTRCDLRGSRMDTSFMDHFMAQKHYIAVRLNAPRELFCIPCQDYQYHSDFDRRLGNGRLFRWGRPTEITTTTTSITSANANITGSGSVSPVPQSYSTSPYPYKAASVDRALTPSGFVNMGNTCFLSSVMQVLLQATVLQRYYTDVEKNNNISRNNSIANGTTNSLTGCTCTAIQDNNSCIACEVATIYRDRLVQSR